MNQHVWPATLTNGDEYTGNQQFKGNGILRWCALCGTHKTMGLGSIQRVLGLRQWVCKQHKKPGAGNA